MMLFEVTNICIAFNFILPIQLCYHVEKRCYINKTKIEDHHYYYYYYYVSCVLSD